MKQNNTKASKKQTNKKKTIVEMDATEQKKPHGNKLFTDYDKTKNLVDGYFKYVDENPMMKKDFIKGGEFAGQIVDIPIDQPYTIVGLCEYLHIDKDTFGEYLTDNDKLIASIFIQAKIKIERQQLTNAMINNYNANLVARLNGLSDNSNVSGNIEHKVTKITFE